MFTEILRFELYYRFTRISTHIYFGLFLILTGFIVFVLGGGVTGAAISVDGSGGEGPHQ